MSDGEWLRIALFLGLCTASVWVAWVWGRMARRITEFRAEYEREPPQLRTDQEWRTPTGNRFLEQRKAELLQAEKVVAEGYLHALSIKHRELARYRGEVGLIEWIRFTYLEPVNGPGWIRHRAELFEQIERLWVGNAQMEIEDRKDRIKRLQLDRGAVGQHPSFDDKRRRFDNILLEVERELRDLAEIVRLAERRASESPKRVEYRDDLELHNIRHEDNSRKLFEGVETSWQVKKKRIELLERVNADQTLSQEDKRELRLEIERAAEIAEGKSAPALRKKPGSIYKEGQ